MGSNGQVGAARNPVSFVGYKRNQRATSEPTLPAVRHAILGFIARLMEIKCLPFDLHQSWEDVFEYSHFLGFDEARGASGGYDE